MVGWLDCREQIEYEDEYRKQLEIHQFLWIGGRSGSFILKKTDPQILTIL